MAPSEQLTSPPVTPIYSQLHPNEPLEFGETAVEFESGGSTHQSRANIKLRFLPDNAVEILCPPVGGPLHWLKELFSEVPPTTKLTLLERGLSIEVLWMETSTDGLLLHPQTSPVTVTIEATNIAKAVWHLFNFPEVRGPESYVLVTGQKPLQGFVTCGRFTLTASGWVITVSANRETSSLAKELKAQGGFAITHAAEVRREDGSAFSTEELDWILAATRYFLSFALGRWSTPSLAVGIDADGNRVFEEWGLGMVAPGAWKGSISWFDQHHAELLTEVFPGFVALWSSAVWKDPLQHSLYWYLGANDRHLGIGVDTGLVLAQAALETLAWTYCVQDRKMVSAEAFQQKGLSAANKVRLLLSSLGIPLEIPSNLKSLNSRRGKKWTDGPEAITKIRNSLVHANAEQNVPEGAYYDAWMLSQWYIELAILRLCGHCGRYANRLGDSRWVGTVEDVPWAAATS